jgi:hypothetical protein
MSLFYPDKELFRNYSPTKEEADDEEEEDTDDEEEEDTDDEEEEDTDDEEEDTDDEEETDDDEEEQSDDDDEETESYVSEGSFGPVEFPQELVWTTNLEKAPEETDGSNLRQVLANKPTTALPPSTPVTHAGHLRTFEVSIDSSFREDTTSNQSATNFSWIPNTSLKNVIKVELHSTEIPNNWFIFNNTWRNNTSILLDSSLVQISSGDYNSSISDLLTALNSQLASSGAGSMAYDASVRRVSWTLPAGSHTVQFANWPRPADFGLGYNLGFRKPAYNNVSGTLIAEASPSMKDDAYILIQIDELEGMMHESYQNSVNAFAKIKVRGAKGATMHDDATTLQSKAVTFRQPTTIHRLNIQIKDKYGQIIDLDGQEWSMSLLFTTIQNSHLNELYRKHDLDSMS